ncbi:SMP-30/gluconolactonase/LRE family protein [Niabella beijingensis]|uniref:SMP-30/gluconolactonase/LRE family protein n=1 Tax=Niabella beijingensis TaxID=2872700 RepID=UPI001CBC6BB5|nr:SMP-30/gluconolactonase/LRE family protein [Niabella beijingensis]MBZ4192166.1 SMP-30/gluconolactonase/LRE family protein [Niabella beijingensis]
MQELKATLLHRDRLLLGEGAAWHAGWQQFIYVDVEGGVVGRIDPATGNTTTINVGRRIGAVLPASGNRLLLALQGALVLLNADTGTLTPLAAIEAHKPENRCNDGKCDAAGRLWIGTMEVDARSGQGALYRFDGRTLVKMISKRSISNGLCWSADNRTMYYIDSPEQNIKAYDFDLSSGTISNERVVVTIDVPGSLPDGMCMDAEGMLWVAIWGGSAVHRYNPRSGALIGRVLVAAPHVSNCAFGGKNGQQLFITTARKDLDAAQLERYPLSGSLFIADTGIKGLRTYCFNDSLD